VGGRKGGGKSVKRPDLSEVEGGLASEMKRLNNFKKNGTGTRLNKSGK